MGLVYGQPRGTLMRRAPLDYLHFAFGAHVGGKTQNARNFKPTPSLSFPVARASCLTSSAAHARHQLQPGEPGHSSCADRLSSETHKRIIGLPLHFWLRDQLVTHVCVMFTQVQTPPSSREAHEQDFPCDQPSFSPTCVPRKRQARLGKSRLRLPPNNKRTFRQLNTSGLSSPTFSATSLGSPTPSLTISLPSPTYRSPPFSQRKTKFSLESPMSPFSPSFQPSSASPICRTKVSTPELKPRRLPVPDARYFECKLTPKTPASARLPRPPPAPLRKTILSRKNSLVDTKQLFAIDDSCQNQFANDFDLSKIGEGCFFDVYRGVRKIDGKEFAIKKSKALFKGRRHRGEYLRELQMVAACLPHPHIVHYHRAWQQQLHFFIQLELCKGTLEDEFNARPHQAPLPFLWKCAVEIAKGLETVHGKGILHLDIKPANVLIGLDGLLKIGDFGQAILRDNFHDGQEGDSRYMAQECLDPDAQPAPSADMFSLGILLFELATNLNPPSDGQPWHDLREGRVAQYLPSTFDPEMGQLIVALLNPDPTQRPSAHQIVAAHAHRLKLNPPPCNASTMSLETLNELAMTNSGSSSLMDEDGEDSDESMPTTPVAMTD